MDYARQPLSGARIAGIALVVLLHALVIYALATGLAHRAIEVVRAPVVTRIIDEAKPPPPEQPPPPPLQLSEPPPTFVPPPEVHIEKPPPPPPKSTAITAVTPVRPPAPAPIPQPIEPVRVEPRIDVRRSEEPEYPQVSRRLGEQGSVVLQVLVGTDGRVIDTKLLQSSGFDRLDQAAIAGVKANYRFIPGTVGGKLQPMWFTFRFTWKLR
jgi:protein TonB